MHHYFPLILAAAVAAASLAGCSSHAAPPAVGTAVAWPSVAAVAKAVAVFGPGARFTVVRGRIVGRAVRAGVAVLMVRANDTHAMRYITVPVATANALHTDVFVLQGQQGSMLVIPR